MKRSEIVTFVRSITDGRFVHIEFVKANGEHREATAQFGVQHPAHVTAPGQGVHEGVSFTEAAQNGVLKFYEPNKINADGTRGAYRSAKIANIISITAEGKKYTIED